MSDELSGLVGEIEYDPGSDSYVLTYDPGGETPVSTVVVDGVAAVTDRDPTAIDPLESVVDTDALDRLFAPTAEANRPAGRVEFPFDGCSVTVTAEGTVRIDADGA